MPKWKVGDIIKIIKGYHNGRTGEYRGESNLNMECMVGLWVHGARGGHVRYFKRDWLVNQKKGSA